MRRIAWESLSLVEVWRELGGPDPAWRGDKARVKAFWRGGDGLSIALDRSKNAWFDHARAEGGGPLDLVRVVLGFDQRAAVAWIAERWGTPASSSPAEDRRLAADRDARRQLSEYSRLWRQGRIQVLERVKDQAFANLEVTDAGLHWRAWERWTGAASDLYLTERLAGESLLDAFRTALTQRPQETARLIAAQRADEEHARDLVAFVIACIEASPSGGANGACAA